MDIDYYELYNCEEDAKLRNNRLAVVIEFDNVAKVVVKWDGDVSSIVIHDRLVNFMKVSVQGNRHLIHISPKYGTQNQKQRVLVTDEGRVRYVDQD